MRSVRALNRAANTATSSVFFPILEAISVEFSRSFAIHKFLLIHRCCSYELVIGRNKETEKEKGRRRKVETEEESKRQMEEIASV